MTYNAALSACDRRSQWRSLIMLHLVGFPLAVRITNFSSMRHSPCSLLSFVKFPPDHLASCWLARVFQCHGSNLLNRLQLLRLDTLISQRLQPDLLSYLYLGYLGISDRPGFPVTLTERYQWSMENESRIGGHWIFSDLRLQCCLQRMQRPAFCKASIGWDGEWRAQ